jgi:F0F1-type ATP synthase assembly protein I
MPEKRPFGQLARGFAVASTLGMGFAAAVGLGVYLGYRCDQALGWQPFCTLALGLVGGIVGIVFVVRTVGSLNRVRRDEDSGAGSSQDHS